MLGNNPTSERRNSLSDLGGLPPHRLTLGRPAHRQCRVWKNVGGRRWAWRWGPFQLSQPCGWGVRAGSHLHSAERVPQRSQVPRAGPDRAPLAERPYSISPSRQLPTRWADIGSQLVACAAWWEGCRRVGMGRWVRALSLCSLNPCSGGAPTSSFQASQCPSEPPPLRPPSRRAALQSRPGRSTSSGN